MEFLDFPLVRIRLNPSYPEFDNLNIPNIGTLLYFLEWVPNNDGLAYLRDLHGETFFVDSYYFDWHNMEEGKKNGDERWG